MSKTLLIISITAIILVGCESTGKIHGVSGGSAVHFEYQQGFLDNDGILKITLPDGEAYSGKFVQKSSTTSGDEWELGESSDDDSFTFNDSTSVSSHADAILLGNKGSTMKCKFQFSNPDSGIDGGGIGSCKTSTDKLVNVTF